MECVWAPREGCIGGQLNTIRYYPPSLILNPATDSFFSFLFFPFLPESCLVSPPQGGLSDRRRKRSSGILTIATPAMADDRGPQMMGVIVALFVTSIISGALRFYTHGVIIKRFFAEDYLTVAALVRRGRTSPGRGKQGHDALTRPRSCSTRPTRRWAFSE